MDISKTLATVIILAAAFTVSLESYRIGFGKYHNHQEMTDYLTQITNEFPNVSSLYSIGKSVLNRELWVVKLTTATKLLSVPNIKIVGNIHGDEPVGREIILYMIQYLLDNNAKNKEINTLLRTTVIHLMPSMNPDGYEKSLPHSCPKDGQPNMGFRRNAYNYDLNRNFPDIFNPNTMPLQPETKAIIDWMKSIPFVMSLALHGGSLVANYPYDGAPDSLIAKLQNLNKTLQIANVVDLYKAYENANRFDATINENPTQDDDVFRFLAKLYAKLHPTMHQGLGCDDNMKFKDGVTNGAAWYQTVGSMQDYNYVWHGCLEITLELSCCKYPPASFLESHWNENLKPLVTWMQQAQRGIKGVVTNQITNAPISNATLSLSDRQSVFYTTKNGEFWKILLPGVYKLRVNAAGYNEKTVRVAVPDRVADNDPSDGGGPRPIVLKIAMELATATSTNPATARTTVMFDGTEDDERDDERDDDHEFEYGAEDDGPDESMMRPAVPVSTFSSSAAAGRRLTGSRVPATCRTLVTAYLVASYVAATVTTSYPRFWLIFGSPLPSLLYALGQM